MEAYRKRELNMSVFYGVSVGPGDPELMTIKAINTIKKCDVIAYDKGQKCNDCSTQESYSFD